MAAQFMVEGTDKNGGYVAEFVSAPDSKRGYTVAREKAEARFSKQGKVGVRVTAIRCVG